MSARAVASICCSPPDSVPAICVLRSARRGKSAKQRSRLLGFWLARRKEGAGEEVLEHRQLAERTPALGAVHQPACADLVRGEPVDALAGEAHLALEHDVAVRAALHALFEAHQPGNRAQQRRLPAPFGPTRPTSSPSFTASDTPFRICALS